MGGGKDSIYDIIYGVDFYSASEGVADEGPPGLFMTTIDSGKHWKQMQFSGAESYHSYGNGMFRAFKMPNTLYTTSNNWDSIDTTAITMDGPLSDNSVMPYSLLFGQGDTFTMVCYRSDSTDTHFFILLAQTTDGGNHWIKLPLPRDVPIYPPVISQIDQQTIVIAGTDSLQRIIISTDRGVTWNVDTVSLDDGRPYYHILAVAVTGAGRVIASIETDSNFEGSTLLAYLETIPSSVAPTLSTQQAFSIFPNPATNEIQITSGLGNISILDPLGRSYEVKQTGNSLDISSLPSGVYFVSDGASRAKFVKE